MGSEPMKVLVFGATGMLGNAVARLLGSSEGICVFGTVRSLSEGMNERYFPGVHLISDIDVNNFDDLVKAFRLSGPDIVVNCIGLVKQLEASKEALSAIPINSLLPHRLADLCASEGSRLIQISTDCVFSGNKGLYTEDDIPDAMDLYGKSKCLGEVYYPHSITLRTSIIGHEIMGARSLLCWFLAQQGRVNGYTKAIFSGLPTIELARVIRDVVIPRPDLFGLYHVASDPIDKYSLLGMIAKTYSKSIEIIPDDRLVIDRSLCAEKFEKATGYASPKWPELVRRMYEFQ